MFVRVLRFDGNLPLLSLEISGQTAILSLFIRCLRGLMSDIDGTLTCGLSIIRHRHLESIPYLNLNFCR